MGWLHVFAVVDVFAVQDRRQERSVTAYTIGQRAVVNTARTSNKETVENMKGGGNQPPDDVRTVR